ncbi:C2 calcium-dependent domain-containing protein 6-like [Actinia tenebrosa]|uniref:C2 calcium-dependent domain-containing protein 6-like n=1 Tax=Actinia tenebrosa TaxID=6105 RepID=A0A6P8JFZ1_ACTTE|nr:C2 calcium-dependent domain-containing protein 6-like [Actinia tenebrosa]
MLADFTSVIQGGEDVKKDEEEDLLLNEKASVPTGLLAIRVFGCSNLYLDKQIIPDHYGLYVNISVGVSSKITSVKSCYKKGKVIWDEIKNFSIPVSNKISSGLNNVCIAVIGFDKQQVRPKYRVLGKIDFHLHKMVKKLWSIDTFELQNKKKRYAGDISIEFAFVYGTFGYGLSSQIENIHSPKEMVNQSAFPRLEPPDTTLNVLGVSCIPRKVTHPKFIPFATKVLDLEPDISPTYGMRVFPQDIFKTRHTLNQKMTRLKQNCAEYSLLSNRVKRISYLKKMMSEKETKHSTLNQIFEQESDSDSSEERSNIGAETTVGLSGALAKTANMAFLAGAPGVMQRRNVRPSVVPSDTDLASETNQQWIL